MKIKISVYIVLCSNDFRAEILKKNKSKLKNMYRESLKDHQIFVIWVVL